MSARQISSAIFFFLLPGMAAGWLLAAGGLRFGHDPAVAGVLFGAFSLAGALAGRWLLRDKRLLGAGLLLLPVIPFFSMRGIFPAISFAFAVLAVRPIRQGNRLLFQTGVLLAVIAGLAAGSRWLTDLLILKSALMLLLPAMAHLLSEGVPHRKSTCTLAVLAGLSLLLLPAKWSTLPLHTLPWGESADLRKTEESTWIRIGDRSYTLPRDLERRMPDLLTAALQPRAERVHALVIGEAPGSAAAHLQQMHWIGKVENRVLLTGLADLFRPGQERSHLIFIQELPGSMPGARDLLFQCILSFFLAPGGVAAAPAEYRITDENFHAIDLPGSGGRMRLWAAKDTPFAATFAQLEERWEERNETLSDIRLTGVMETLYRLRPAEQEFHHPVRSPMDRMLQKVRHYLPPAGLCLTGIVLFLLGICWFSRSPRYGENFAIYVHGTGCMLGLLTLLQAAGKYQLVIPAVPLMALFGLIAIAMPCRGENPGKTRIPAMVCAALAGGMVLYNWPVEVYLQQGVPGSLLAILLVSGMLLAAPALKFGSIHKGGESARYLHFAGLLTGAILSLLAPHWAKGVAALLLLAA